MGFIRFITNSSADERAFHEIRIAYTPGMTAISESVLHDMSVLDSKSAALLTFISVVLAALIFALGMVDSNQIYASLIKSGLYAFMVAFALAAWINLRCLYTMGRQSFPTSVSEPDYENRIVAEVALRKRRYRLSLLIVELGVVSLLIFMIVWLLFSERLLHGIL